VPISPATGTPARKRSLAHWDSSRKHSITLPDQKEAPGRLQSSRDGAPILTRGHSISLQPSEPPSPDLSRTSSQNPPTTSVDGKEVFHRLELVRSQSEMAHSWTDSDGNRRFESFVFGRERKESTASNVSGSTLRENIKRMIFFWDATPEEIAGSLTKLEWDCFSSLGV